MSTLPFSDYLIGPISDHLKSPSAVIQLKSELADLIATKQDGHQISEVLWLYFYLDQILVRSTLN